MIKEYRFFIYVAVIVWTLCILTVGISMLLAWM